MLNKEKTQLLKYYQSMLENDKMYSKLDILSLFTEYNAKKSNNANEKNTNANEKNTNANEKNTITLTFGDAGETHNGMKLSGILGKENSGYQVEELKAMYEYFNENSVECEYHNLSIDDIPENKASIIILRNYLDTEKSKELYDTLLKYQWDRKFWSVRQRKVLNKHARSNIMIEDGKAQAPNYENGEGTIIDGNCIPSFCSFKKSMVENLNTASNTDKADNLICEGNQYFDHKKCGIGYHGDTERRKVIAIRLGDSMSMNWQWFHRNKPIGNTFEFTINNGDLYVMSEKAVGNDWRKSSKKTIRHAAGSNKYTSLEKYKKNK